jgi:hypothetical protein
MTSLSRAMYDAMNDVDVYIESNRLVDRPREIIIRTFDQRRRVTKIVASRYIFTMTCRSDDGTVISRLFKDIIKNTNSGAIRWNIEHLDPGVLPHVIPLIKDAIEIHIDISFPLDELMTFKRLRCIVLRINKYDERVYDTLRCISDKTIFPLINMLVVSMKYISDRDLDDIPNNTITDMPFLSAIETVRLDLASVYVPHSFSMSLAGIKNLRVDLSYKYTIINDEISEYHFLNHKCLTITGSVPYHTHITTTNVDALCVNEFVDLSTYYIRRPIIHLLDKKTRSFVVQRSSLCYMQTEQYGVINGHRCIGKRDREPRMGDVYTMVWMFS